MAGCVLVWLAQTAAADAQAPREELVFEPRPSHVPAEVGVLLRIFDARGCVLGYMIGAVSSLLEEPDCPLAVRNAVAKPVERDESAAARPIGPASDVRRAPGAAPDRPAAPVSKPVRSGGGAPVRPAAGAEGRGAAASQLAERYGGWATNDATAVPPRTVRGEADASRR